MEEAQFGCKAFWKFHSLFILENRSCRMKNHRDMRESLVLLMNKLGVKG